MELWTGGGGGERRGEGGGEEGGHDLREYGRHDQNQVTPTLHDGKQQLYLKTRQKSGHPENS